MCFPPLSRIIRQLDFFYGNTVIPFMESSRCWGERKGGKKKKHQRICISVEKKILNGFRARGTQSNEGGEGKKKTGTASNSRCQLSLFFSVVAKLLLQQLWRATSLNFLIGTLLNNPPPSHIFIKHSRQVALLLSVPCSIP